jgi:hypothetical protein
MLCFRHWKGDMKMNLNNSNSQNDNNKAPEQFSVNTYITLFILKRMKEILGLEAMVEYLDTYLVNIEEYNEEVKMAVEHALKRINVARIYEEARTWEKERKFSS